MLVVNRFRVPETDEAAFREALDRAHAALAAQRGYVDGAVGRNVDDPALWVLQTRWADTGSYRRALSAYDVKVTAVPTLSLALDEPSAYEVLAPGEEPNSAAPRQIP